MRKTEVIKKLKKLFPDIEGICDGDEWLGRKREKFGAVHLGNCAEGGTIDGLPACDYYSFEKDPHEKTYVLGVHKKLEEALNECGYFAECYDPGTWLAYRG